MCIYVSVCVHPILMCKYRCQMPGHTWRSAGNLVIKFYLVSCLVSLGFQLWMPDLLTHGLLEFSFLCFPSPHRSTGIRDIDAVCPVFIWILILQTQILMLYGKCLYPLSHLSSPKQFFKDMLLGIFYWDNFSLCGPGCHGTFSVDQPGTGLTRLALNSEPVSASWVLGLKMCATIIQQVLLEDFNLYLWLTLLPVV